jgi:hypothetical protein
MACLDAQRQMDEAAHVVGTFRTPLARTPSCS